MRYTKNSYVCKALLNAESLLEVTCMSRDEDSIMVVLFINNILIRAIKQKKVEITAKLYL